jgi:general transcription factor 3C polypeptide 3 (transcription factor C subunit 4)
MPDEDAEEDGENEEDGLTVDAEMENFYDDLKAARGFKKGGRVGRRGGRRAVGEQNLSFEVKRLMGDANQAYVKNDADIAFATVKKIIQIEPGVYPAWKMLGEIFKERGDDRRCLLAWLTACHAHPRDTDMWLSCARMSLEQLGPNGENYRDQALYCFSRAISSSPANIDAIYDRSLLYRELGQLNKAAEGFAQLNKLVPNDMSVLRDIATVYIELDRIPEAIELYQRSVEFFKSNGNPEMKFGWSELNILIELYCLAKMWEEAIHVLRNLARWLYGRAEEDYWDRITGDDREWDADPTRRNLVHDFENGLFAPETYSLPTELRVKLGVCRLKLGNKPEAMVCCF